MRGQLVRVDAGLCDTCLNQRLVRSGRGSEFSLCRLARVDPRFPKYPRIPVGACPGWVRRPDGVDPADAARPPAGGGAGGHER